MNLGIGLGGITGGLIAHVAQPRTFTILFVVDALTFLVYVLVLSRIRDPGIAVEDRSDTKASYGAVYIVVPTRSWSATRLSPRRSRQPG